MFWIKAGQLRVAFSRHAMAGSRRGGWEIQRMAHEFWQAGSVVRYGERGLNENSLYFVQSGSARFTGPGGVVMLGPSSLVLLRKGLIFTIDEISPPWLEVLAVRFAGRRLVELAEKVMRNGAAVLKCAEPDRALWILESLLEQLLRHDPVALEHADVWVQGLLLLALQQSRRAPATSAAETRFLRCRAQIDREFTTLAGVGEAAARCGLHRDYLNRLFRRFAEMTVEEYLRRLRLDTAARLLLTTDRKLADIGIEVGYADEFSFSKAFKRRFGCAPRHWRQSGGGLA